MAEINEVFYLSFRSRIKCDVQGFADDSFVQPRKAKLLGGYRNPSGGCINSLVRSDRQWAEILWRRSVLASGLPSS